MKADKRIERMMFGFIESQTLFVCHKLRIFEYLGSNGPSGCAEIADGLALSRESVDRLLTSAVCIGLLTKMDGKFSLDDQFVPYLVSTSSKYLGGRFAHYCNVSYGLFNYLEAAIRENRPQWNKINGKSNVGRIYTDCVYADNKATEEFLESMWSSGYSDSLDLCDQYSFDGCQRMVDVAGATGSFAISALKKNKNLSAVVMDLPPVETHALRAFEKNGCSGRAEFYSGDMFRDPLPKGDIYVLGYVLSDWNEDVCHALIQKVYQSLDRSGKIVILEKFFNKDKTGPYLTGMLNLTMLLEMDGKHRSVDEYIGWLEMAGFGKFSAVYSAGEKHMLVGSKV